MVRVLSSTNILMELRKICQHPYLNAPEMEKRDLPEEEQHKRLTDASGKLKFLKQLLPALKERGFRVLLFSQYKIALDIIEDFLHVEGYKYLRLDGDVAQVNRQKDMDKFNALDSEYFIFLLTTRAGGVGINLATADAVILFDPDFNPQMDLQAISRSHRYGQTKRVLVFRLMMENSVETRIMNNGKRKMVLDHLVVQQLGKETEDGEIDNMILYGAEEIIKSDPNDTSADRVWTKQLIDELIDGAEKEAEEQAKEMKEREEREATEDSSKAGGGFAFARVWEAKTKKFQEVDEEEEEPEPFEDDDAWAEFMKSAEAQAKDDNNVVLEEGRRRRARKQVTYIDPLGNMDDSPSKDKRKGKKGKETDDTDFEAPIVSDSDSDSDAVFYDAVPESIAEIGIAVPGRPSVVSSAPNALDTSIQMSQAERMAWARKLQATQGGPVAPAMSQTAVRQTATAGPGPTTMQNQAAGHASHSQHHPGSSPVLVHDQNMSVLSHGPVFRPTNPGMVVPSVPQPQPQPQPLQPVRGRPPTAASALHTSQVEAARQILVELKGILQKSNNEAFLRVWYDVASFGKSVIDRKQGYWEIAVAIDAMRRAQGLPQKFTLEGAVKVVAYYIDQGTRVRSLVSENSRRPPPGPAPSSLPPAQYVPLIPPDHPLYVPVRSYHPGPHRPQPIIRPQPQPSYPQMASNIPIVLMPQNRISTHSGSHFHRADPPLPNHGIVQHRPRPAEMPYNIPHGAMIHNNNAVYQGHINLMPVHPAQPAPHYAPPPPITAHISAHISPAQSPVLMHPPAVVLPPPPPPRAHISPIASPVNSPTISEQQPRQQRAPMTTPGPPAPPPVITPAPPRKVIPLSSSFTANEVTPPTTDGSPGSVLQLGDSSRFSVPTPPPKHLDKGDKCFWCQSTDHKLQDCPNLVPMEQLDGYEKELLAMEPSEEKDQGLNAVRKLREAHVERAKKRKRKPRPSKGKSGTAGTTPAPSSVNGGTVSPRAGVAAAHDGKSANDAIVIDDDDDEPPPPKKKHHANGATAGSAAASAGTGAQSVAAQGAPPVAPPRVSASSAFKPAPERTPLIAPTPPRPVARAPAPAQPATSNPVSSTVAPAPSSAAPVAVATSIPEPIPVPAAPGSQPLQVASQPTQINCQICLGTEDHMAKECPVVKAGPESIATAMQRIENDELRNVLGMIRSALLTKTPAASQEQPRCAFCGNHCGQSVRECAETRGSRKELKLKIRELELPLRESEAKMQILKARRVQLLAAPKAAERQDMLRQTDEDIASTERLMAEVQQPALHPLYQAYLSWPKPSRSDKATANGA